MDARKRSKESCGRRIPAPCRPPPRREFFKYLVNGTFAVIVAVLGAALFLTYLGATAPLPPTAASLERIRMEAEALPPRARRGLEVYEEQGCAACHIIAGVGSPAGPPLDRVGRRRDPEWLARYIAAPESINPATEMPAFDDLAEEELDALVAYLQTLR